MQFRIADTFTDSLAKLTNDEQKSVKTTVFDLQMNPTGNGLRLHKLKRGRDKNFWSVSASMDLRIIIHKTDNSTLVCYVDHHDAAYEWAANRKLEVHPQTGAAQLVEVVETVREIEVPKYVAPSTSDTPSTNKPLRDYADEFLLKYGIPADWLARLRNATENELLELVEHLPAEAAEAILDIATGTIPPVPTPIPTNVDPFDHPDAQRRFRIIENKEELEAALEYPWDKWTIFLHPAQRTLVKKEFNGSARVAGSAGTGKTVVALHRAVHLARVNDESRILLTTFSGALANALRTKLWRLLRHEPRLGENIEVRSLNHVGQRLYRMRGGKYRLADLNVQKGLILNTAQQTEHDFSAAFLWNEWQYAVDLWQIDSWEAYRTIQRIGRKRRLNISQREQLWRIYESVMQQLDEQRLITQNGIFAWLANYFQDVSNVSPYNYVVVDEAQDISVSQLRFLAAIAGNEPDGLFLAGDLGQRIFQAPFSWKNLGVDVRGRSHTLRINYRTSHQIRQQADRLLEQEIADVDGNREDRRQTQSVFNGPSPLIIAAKDEVDEQVRIAEWLNKRLREGVKPHEIAIFVRSKRELNRARHAIELTNHPYCELNEQLRTQVGHLVVSTMHLAKGLEFRAVVVMACDADIIPNENSLESVSDMNELNEMYERERRLLYVACTRARDYLILSYAEEGSEFLDDMKE